jgi:hypothetical protein
VFFVRQKKTTLLSQSLNKKNKKRLIFNFIIYYLNKTNSFTPSIPQKPISTVAAFQLEEVEKEKKKGQEISCFIFLKKICFLSFGCDGC